MSDPKVIELVVLQPIKIILDGGKEYTLVFNYKAIARAEKALGSNYNLLSPRQWFEMSPSQFCTVVWAGFAKHHADVTLEQVEDMLNPGQQGRLKDAIFDLFFPGVLEKILKSMTEDEKPEGEKQPDTTTSKD
jgi:hypothetical protein